MSETEPVQVLIVEADGAFRGNLSERLRRDGAVVFEAGNEPEARDIAQGHNIDVALLVGRGINQSGLPLLRFLKESRPMIEVIMLSLAEHHSLYVSIEPDAGHGWLEPYLEAGIEHRLKKPWRPFRER